MMGFTTKTCVSRNPKGISLDRSLRTVAGQRLGNPNCKLVILEFPAENRTCIFIYLVQSNDNLMNNPSDLSNQKQIYQIKSF